MDFVGGDGANHLSLDLPGDGTPRSFTLKGSRVGQSNLSVWLDRVDGDRYTIQGGNGDMKPLEVVDFTVTGSLTITNLPEDTSKEEESEANKVLSQATAKGRQLADAKSKTYVGVIGNIVETTITTTGGLKGQRAKVDVQLLQGTYMLEPRSTSFALTIGTPFHFKWRVPTTSGFQSLPISLSVRGKPYATLTATVNVIKLDSVKVYFRATSPYPVTGTPLPLYALVWATGGDSKTGKTSQHVYTNSSIANDGKWWSPGFIANLPDSSVENGWKLKLLSGDGKTYRWPKSWPMPKFNWEWMSNYTDSRVSTDSKGHSTHKRHYFVSTVSASGTFGSGFHGALNPERGVVRLRVELARHQVPTRSDTNIINNWTAVNKNDVTLDTLMNLPKGKTDAGHVRIVTSRHGDNVEVIEAAVTPQSQNTQTNTYSLDTLWLQGYRGRRYPR